MYCIIFICLIQVIASLKRALQPSVTDLEVKFAVTSGFDALEAPDKLPIVFSGDKTVIYGIFRSKAASDSPLDAGVSGTATLKGKILGVPFEYSIPFDIPSQSDSTDSDFFQMPIVHQLAAKSLIRDWEHKEGWASTASESERKQEMIRVSIESSVVSAHTAYIAVDEEQDKPIEGAIQTWDLSATMAATTGGFGFSGHKLKKKGGAHVMLFGGPPPPAPMASMSSFGFGGSGMAPPPPGSAFGGALMGGPMPPPLSRGFGSGPQFQQQCAFAAGPPPLSGFAAGPPPPPARSGFAAGPPPPPPPAQSDAYMDLLSSDSSTNVVPTNRLQAKSRSVARASPFSTSISDELTQLISLQQAEGFWNLDKVTKLVKKSITNPIAGVDPTVWATVVALVLLESRFSQQEDEWELVAMKAETWLSVQILPAGVDLERLKQEAKNLV